MKSSLKKFLRFNITLFILLAVGLILYSVTVYEKDYPAYSSYNAKKAGIKALYLLTSKCGFEVSRYHYPAKFLNEDAVMVTYRPAESLFNEIEEQDWLKKWLKNDNTLLMILDERNIGELWIFDFIFENRKWHEVDNIGNITVTWYGLESGTVCVLGSADSFINENISSSDAAVAFIKVLAKINNPKVLFNEYYQFMQVPSPNIWDLIGHTGQLILIQLVFVILLIVLRGWKPFGRVRSDREMVIRPENEVVKALSGLYQRMKAHPLVLSNYYGYFTQKYGRYLITSGHLQEKAINTLAECEFYLKSGKVSKKELRNIVLRLEKLESEIKNSGKPGRKE